MDCPHCKASNPFGAANCLRCRAPLVVSAPTVVAEMTPPLQDSAVTIVDGAQVRPQTPSDVTLDAVSSPAMDIPTAWSVPPTVQSLAEAQASVAPLKPGSLLGNRYEIVDILGEGGMGAVYKARDRELDRQVALKVIRPELAGRPEILQRFKQELILARKITHRNVIRIYDLGEASGIKFITMEFIEGRDLKSLLAQDHKLSPEKAVDIIQQVCLALEAAHAEGVVHRDLKPQNIMVDQQGRVSVMDFGIARSLEFGGMTQTGALVGTPEYMSPEQVRGEHADARSDIFTLGVIFQELLTGALPYQAETAMASMFKRTRERAVSVHQLSPDVPQFLSDIVAKCLEIEPRDRFQTAREVYNALDAWKGGVASTVGNRTLRRVRQALRNRAAIGIVVTLLLLLVFPTVRYFVFRGKGGKAIFSIAGVPPLSEGKFVAALPFRVLGQTQSLEDVAEGLHEAISAKLFQLGDVRLASDVAVAKVSDKDPVEKTAHGLGANLIISGTIQGNTDNLAIIVNLLDVADGKRLWSDTISGNAQDLLTLEDKVCNGLVSALSLKPEDEEHARNIGHPTENIEAYDLYLKGRSLMRGVQNPKNIQAAISLFNQAVKKDSEFALAYAGLADASLSMYDATKDSLWSQKALGAAEQAEHLDDKLPEVHFSLGDIYRTTGQSAQAIVELKRALDLAPNSDEGYRRLGGAYLSAGQGDKAIQALQKAIEINPYYWSNYNSLGSIYIELGDYAKALDAFQHVKELEPDNIWGYQNIAAVYFDQGKFEEAIPYFKKTLEIQPDGANYSNLATAYYFQKRYKESIPSFEKAVEMAPADEVFRGNLADAYRATGDKERAIATYDKAIVLAYKELQVNPRKASTMGHIGVYYARKGNSAQGVDFARRARRIDPADVDLMYDAAVVFALANDPKDALTELRDAFQSGYSTQQARNDPDFQSLQNNPDFQKLLTAFDNKKSSSR
jgi:eukaryotic-like serine/threonine-protein kinase